MEGKGAGKRKRWRGETKEGQSAENTTPPQPGKLAQAKGEGKSDGNTET